jgi:DNA-binding transcriptional ArsR family regulator
MESPNFYAVIPADVRYDTTLTANTKLLYGEITALCNQKGYCWATNAYFARLYEVTGRTVTRWLSELENGGYVTVKMRRDPKNRMTERHIYLTRPTIQVMSA